MSKNLRKARSATLAKGLEILNFLSNQKKPVTLRNIMQGLQLTKPTAHRLISTLMDYGLLQFKPSNNTYKLGMRLFELSRQAWQDLNLRQSAFDKMQELNAKTGETVSLAILTADGGIYIDELQSKYPFREQSRVGQQVSLLRTAIGKSLISGLVYDERVKILEEHQSEIKLKSPHVNMKALGHHLDLVNARGYAIEFNEDQPGSAGVAAPIIDTRGVTVAAIGLTGASERLDKTTLHRYASLIIEATRKASLYAGGNPRPISSAPCPASLPKPNIKVLAQVENLIGESPTISHDNRWLFWIDSCHPCIFRLDLEKNELKQFEQQEMVTAVYATQSGLLVACLSGLKLMSPNTGKILRDLGHPEADIPTNRFNDGKCDDFGRFWVGTLAFNLTKGAGALYCIAPDGKASCMETGLTLPNGLDWSPDRTKMYLADTADRVIYVYDYDNIGGVISNRRPFIVFSDDILGAPDGLDVDENGNLWIAMWDGWCIVKYSAAGLLLETIATGVPRPTSCLFLDWPVPRLVVTTARIRVDNKLMQTSPESGALLEISLS